MFTDGPRVYFAEFEASRLSVMQVSTLGGESQRVPVPFDFTGVVDLSVAQSKLLLQTPTDASATFGTLWTMPLPAGQPQSNGETGSCRCGNGVRTGIGSTTRVDPNSGLRTTMKASPEKF